VAGKRKTNMKAEDVELDDRKITEISIAVLDTTVSTPSVFFSLPCRVHPSAPYHHHIPALLLATGDFPPPHLTVEEIRSSSFRELLDSSWSVGVLFILYHFSKLRAPLPTVIAAIPWSSWSLYVRFLPLKPIFSSSYSTSIPLTPV